MPSQSNFRLPGLTQEQIKELSDKLGMTATQVVVLAVDRLAAIYLAPHSEPASQMQDNVPDK